MNELEKIVQAYSKPIFGYALKKIGNRQDAEDLAQDILYQVITAFTRPNEAIKDQQAYIWSIARHTWANWIRKKTSAPGQIDWISMNNYI